MTKLKEHSREICYPAPKLPHFKHPKRSSGEIRVTLKVYFSALIVRREIIRSAVSSKPLIGFTADYFVLTRRKTFA